jgi:nucleoside-diphosphate-sugar epimerase
MNQKVALVVGSTGITGSNLAKHLVHQGWTVYGLARKAIATEGIIPVVADLSSQETLVKALAEVKPTHIFFTTWVRKSTEAENIIANSAMVRNLLDAVAIHRTVVHVALVTGLKHYLGPFEAYGKGVLPATPFREEQERLNIENFYYAQEDEVFKASKRDGFTWSVHRPHTVIGFAVGNAMNMGVTLAVYASICHETKRPFVFPGSLAQWNGLTDVTDARLLAKHLEWASTHDISKNQAFNIVNGDVFRWNWMWSQLARWFEIQAAPYPDKISPLEIQLKDSANVWKEMAEKYHLIEPDLGKLTSTWHTDADLGRPIEVMTDMSKSRKMGFLEYQSTIDSFFDLFEQLRRLRIIP